MNRAVRYILNNAYPGIYLDKYSVVEVISNEFRLDYANEQDRPAGNYPVEIVTMQHFVLRGIHRTWSIYCGRGKDKIIYHSFRSTITFSEKFKEFV